MFAKSAINYNGKSETTNRHESLLVNYGNS
jgi:hypothetical protein